MSKTTELQIEKCRVLINGLRKHMGEVADKGINGEELDAMERNISLLVEANRECDNIRAELSRKVKHMNGLLKEVKEAYADNKRKIKGNYPQEQWMRYGVQDKR